MCIVPDIPAMLSTFPSTVNRTRLRVWLSGWHLGLMALFGVLLLASAFAANAQTTAEGRQWQAADWPTGRPMSLFDLVEQGYEVRAYQPGLERSWLYLQKGRKLFRCHTPEVEPTEVLCQELVRPF